MYRFFLRICAIIFFSFLFMGCDTKNKVVESAIIRKNYYPNGKIKDSIHLNKDGLQHGASFYFNGDGRLDSSVNFDNGKRHGLTTIDNGKDGWVTWQYVQNEFVREKQYDTTNILIYENPLDVEALPKTSYQLKSGRTYFDQRLGDTIVFINPQLPFCNYNIESSGALLSGLKPYNVRKISVSKPGKSLKDVMIRIKIFSHWTGSTEYLAPDRVDTLLIPVK